ncbi:MAG TPA: hypothetical protein PKA53_00290 [Sphingobacterium sp.]|nr:hypothetical protein [Sphingobacterium sp.]
MRSFFYFNNDKKWCGPFTYWQMVQLIFKARLAASTSVCRASVANPTGHPSVSLYASYPASKWTCFPRWIFKAQRNEFIADKLRNLSMKIRGRKHQLNYHDTPLEIKSLIKSAIRINLIPSLVALRDFNVLQRYQIALSYFDIEKHQQKKTSGIIRLIPDSKRGIYFEITINELVVTEGVLKKESYGLHRPQRLGGTADSLQTERDVIFDFSTRWGGVPQVLKGRLRQVQRIAAHNYSSGYNRVFIKIDQNYELFTQTFPSNGELKRLVFDHEPFNINHTIFGHSIRDGSWYITVSIFDTSYLVYIANKDIFVIEGLSQESLTDFRRKAEVIRTSLAVISGTFLSGECHYIFSVKPDFSAVDGYSYYLEKPSVYSARQAVNGAAFRQWLRETGEDPNKYFPLYISEKIFSTLCEQLLESDELTRAANLIISAINTDDLVQQGAFYSVALEAITNKLGKYDTKALKPVTDPKMADSLKRDLKAVLERYSEQIPDEKRTILEKQLNNINNPPNSDKLTKTFELLKISLSNLDKEYIKNRNRYLHGSSPLKLSQNFELNMISLRLHSLIVALFLKNAGYQGHIINLDAHLYVTDQGVLEAIAEEIHELSILDLETKKSLSDENIALIESVKSKLKLFQESSADAGLFRMI